MDTRSQRGRNRAKRVVRVPCIRTGCTRLHEAIEVNRDRLHPLGVLKLALTAAQRGNPDRRRFPRTGSPT